MSASVIRTNGCEGSGSSQSVPGKRFNRANETSNAAKPESASRIAAASSGLG